jgi:hypothetical protein
MVKKIAVAAVALATLLALAGLALPRRVHVERAVTVEAPRESVFAIVNGFGRFNEWSPWFELDPHAKYVTEGPASGVGAALRWQGDPDAVGTGSIRIVDSRPPESVTTEIVFGPLGGVRSRFVLSAFGDGTRLAWDLDADLGANPFGRYLGPFLDWFVGRDFERGLERLKALAERGV